MGRRRGRWAWVWTLLAIAIVALLIAAWMDGGAEPLRWIEQAVPAPAEGA